MKLSKRIPAVWLEGEVEYPMTKKLMQFYNSLNGSKEPVIIYLNSDGGTTSQAFEMIRMITRHGNTTIIAYGECSSSASLILQPAVHRAATSSCEILIHYGHEEITSTTEKRAAEREMKLMKRLYLEKATVSKQAVGRWFSKETYMTAEHALKVGLIDEVLL